MTINYNWQIALLDYENSDGFVSIVHWVVSAIVDGEEKAHRYGATGLERPANLIPYEGLTKDLVIEWVKDQLGIAQVQDIESSLSEEIRGTNNNKISAGIPWATS